MNTERDWDKVYQEIEEWDSDDRDWLRGLVQKYARYFVGCRGNEYEPNTIPPEPETDNDINWENVYQEIFEFTDKEISDFYAFLAECDSRDRGRNESLTFRDISYHPDDSKWRVAINYKTR